MANFGRRMVNEELIAQIGEGTEYTAGTGIDITEDVISVDNTVAMKTDLSDCVKQKTYVFTDNPFTTEGWLTKVPVLQTNSFTPETDAIFGNNPVIALDQNNRDDNLCYLKGYFVIRDTANNTYSVFVTEYNQITASTDDSAFYVYNVQRSGNNDWTFLETYYRDVQSVTDADSNTSTIYRLGRRNTSDTTVVATGLSQAVYKFKLAGNTIGTNKNYCNGFQVPATEGTYLLKATVDANGKLDKFEWVAESDYKNI